MLKITHLHDKEHWLKSLCIYLCLINKMYE